MSGINTRSGGLQPPSSTTITNEENVLPDPPNLSSAEADRLQALEDAAAAAALEQQNNPPITIQQRLARAQQAKLGSKKNVNVEKGLEVLYKQLEGVDIETAEFLALNLSEEELATCLDRFELQPIPPIVAERSTGTSVPQRTNLLLSKKLIVLGSVISPSEADAFFQMSKQDHHGELTIEQVVSDDAEFLIASSLWVKAQYLNITPDLAKNWKSQMTVQELAKHITQIFGAKDRIDQKSLVDKITEFNLELDSEKMHLYNLLGEEEKLNDLNQLVVHATVADLEGDKMLKLVKKLNKKVDKNSTLGIEIEAYEPKPKTIYDWAIMYKFIMEKGRKIIAEAERFGALRPPRLGANKPSYQQVLKRGLPNVNDPIIQKRAKSNSERSMDYQKSLTFIKNVPFCNGSGRAETETHKTTTCRMVNGDNRHPEANVESVSYDLSTFGKQWLANSKLGPFVNAKFLLNGTARPKVMNKPNHICKPLSYHTTLDNVSLVASVHTDGISSVSTTENTLIESADRISASTEVNTLTHVNHSDYLQMFVSISQMDQHPNPSLLSLPSANSLEEARESRSIRVPVTALLDSGSLAGDFISRRMIDKLSASKFVTHVNTTVCSGFDNHCLNKFPSILLDLLTNLFIQKFCKSEF